MFLGGAVTVTFACLTCDSGSYAEHVLRQLGFKRPATVNLPPFSQYALRADPENHVRSDHANDLVAALKKYGCLPDWHPART